MTKLASQIILTPEELQAVGSIAVECAFFEAIVEQNIWHLCGFKEKTGRLFTATMLLDRKVDLLRGLVKQKVQDEEVWGKFHSLFSEVKEHIQHRNTAIHGIWGVPKLYQVRGKEGWFREGDAAARKKLRASDKPRTLKTRDLITTATKFSESSQLLSRYLYEYGVWPPRQP